MQHRADLADPLVDIRDVVESFRAYQLTLPGWDETLRRAIAALGRISPPEQVDAALPGLLPESAYLARQWSWERPASCRSSGRSGSCRAGGYEYSRHSSSGGQRVGLQQA